MTDTYACGITMHRPTGDLYEILGFDIPVDPIVVAGAGIRLQEQNGFLTPDQSYAWKALSDHSYALLYSKERNTEALYRAGFFDDGLPMLVQHYKAADPYFAATPVQKLLDNFNKRPVSSKNWAVLVTTGGMAPIHNGHIAMMEEARKIAEDNGFAVLTGYFAPGHDSYVGKKYGGTAAIPAEHRCAMVELATQDSDWLDCDPWAARYMPAEINFTQVVQHLDEQIAHQTGILVDVIYVYGSDNEGFGAAMPHRHSIMVPRSAISSKLAREGNHDHLDPKVRDYLLTWDKEDTGELPYLIRNEENEAIRQWSNIVPLDQLEKRRIQLQSTVRLGIAQIFKSLGHTNKVHLLPISNQAVEAKKVIGDRKTISLDAFFRGADFRIQSTRYFAMSSSQFKPLYRAERIGCLPLLEQGEQVAPGDYVLVEDDSVTGGTIMSALSVLPQGVNVTDKVILSDFADYAGVDYYDVVDLRDFIVGSQHGGLSVLTGLGHKARAPYALPYVSLRARAKIPAQAELEISRVIWQANVRFFKDTTITLNDCDEGLKVLAVDMGFEAETLVENFCQWHVDKLMEPFTT